MLNNLSSEQRAYVDAVIQTIRQPLRIGHCFDNAKLITMADPSGRIKYVEGLLISLDSDMISMPHKHAWNTIDCTVFDITLHLSGYRGLVRYEAKSYPNHAKVQ